MLRLMGCCQGSYIYMRTHGKGATSSTTISQDALVRSLQLSVLSFAKAWIEAWMSARAREQDMRQYLVQQMQMGAGMPLDAIGRNAISQWKSSFALSAGQVRMLAVALRENTSMTTLDLSGAQLDGASGDQLAELLKASASLTSWSSTWTR